MLGLGAQHAMQGQDFEGRDCDSGCGLCHVLRHRSRPTGHASSFCCGACNALLNGSRFAETSPCEKTEGQRASRPLQNAKFSVNAQAMRPLKRS